MNFSSEILADSKNSRTFASLLKTSTLEKEVWRDGRVVDCGGLENRCTARYRGFESLSLRQRDCESMICNLFFFISCLELLGLYFVLLVKESKMNRYEWKVKWEWVTMLLIIILFMALGMHC